MLSSAVNIEKQKGPETFCLVTTDSGTGQGSRLGQSSTPLTNGTTILKSHPAFGRQYVRAATGVFNNS